MPALITIISPLRSLRHSFIQGIIAFLLAIVSTGAYGQSGSITVNLKDETGSGAAFAKLGLYRWPDSTLAAQQMAGADGNAVFSKLPNGRYRVFATLVGYQPWWSNSLDITSGEALNVTGTMSATLTTTKTVEVVGRPPLVRQEAGKTIIDVANSSVGEGLDAFTVLRRLPGVTVNGEQNINLRGKGGVMVMIDDKPTFLSPEQLATMLRSIPASQVKEVELITQPDARYDAQGTAGIINIKLKRSKLQGYNGEFHTSVGQGVYHKSNTGGSINYATGDWKHFGSIGYADRGWLMQIRNDRTYPYTTAQGTQNEGQQQSMYYSVKTQSPGLRLGTEYNNGVTEVRVSGVSRFNNEQFRSFSNARLLDGTGATTTTFVAKDYNPDQFSDLEFYGEMSHKLDTTGQKLSLRTDWGQFSQRSSQIFQNWATPAGSANTIYSENRMTFAPNNGVWATKLDYELPLPADMKMSAGLKYTIVSVRTNTRISDWLNGEYVPNPGRDNDFVYREEIRAAYAQLSRKKDKWSYQLGLRAEQWVVTGDQNFGTVTFGRNLTYFFPSLSVEWQQNAKTSLALTGSRRINRPSYGALNSYAFQMDNYSFYAGNPNLVPEIAYQAELTYSMMEGALAVTLSGGLTDQSIAENSAYRLSDTSRLLLIAPVNIPRFANAGLFVAGSLEPLNWLTVDYWGGFIWNSYSGNILGGYFANNRVHPTFSLTNTVKLGGDWAAEISGNYNGVSANSLYVALPNGQMSVGIRKSVFDKAGKVSLTFQDIFWTDSWTTDLSSRWLNHQGFFRGDSRVVMLSFTYNFGNQELKSAKKNDRDSELQRMGGR